MAITEGEPAPKKAKIGEVGEKKITKRNKKNKKAAVFSIEKPAFFFPHDIIAEILSRLPVESLLRFKCVCKDWYSLIQDRYFISKHSAHASIVIHYDEDRFVTDPNIRDAMIEGKFEYRGGFHGMILERGKTSRKYRIRNPATRQVLYLPDPHTPAPHFHIVHCLIPSTGEYVLVAVPIGSLEGYKVLKLGSDDLSWKPLKIPHSIGLIESLRDTRYVKINGVLHFVWLIEVGSNLVIKVGSIDMMSESFTETTMPQGFFSDLNNFNAIEWDKRVAIACVEEENLGIVALEDYKKQKWSERKTNIPLRFLKENQDMKENLRPLFLEGDELGLMWDQRKVIYYNVNVGNILETLVVEDGKRILYNIRHSLVGFKGVHPVRRRPKINL